MLLAAADQPGRGARLWQAAAALAIPESAAVPAEAAGLVAFWPEVRFSHPLVRSAIYYAATPGQRRRAHRVLAAACDPDLDADARAWHLAAAAAGPDERVAAEQEAAAERAGNRGGYAAAAALLERAALLTPDRGRRAERRLSAAEAHLLAGTVDRAGALLAEATTGLTRSAVDRAGHPAGRAGSSSPAGTWPRPPPPWSTRHDDCGRSTRGAARDALLSALEATVFAGWAPCATLLQEIARTARDLPPTGDPPDSAADLLLQGYTARVTGGYAAAVPALRRAVQAFLADDVDPDVALRRL